MKIVVSFQLLSCFGVGSSVVLQEQRKESHLKSTYYFTSWLQKDFTFLLGSGVSVSHYFTPETRFICLGKAGHSIRLLRKYRQ